MVLEKLSWEENAFASIFASMALLSYLRSSIWASWRLFMLSIWDAIGSASAQPPLPDF